MTKNIIIILVIVLLVIGGYFWWRSAKEEAPALVPETEQLAPETPAQ